MTEPSRFADVERLIVDYFEAAGCEVAQDGLEWFLSLYDEGPAISLTSLAAEIIKGRGPISPPPAQGEP
jgi:hypothetical protein